MTYASTDRCGSLSAYTRARRRAMSEADSRMAEALCSIGERAMRKSSRRRPHRSARIAARACAALLAMTGAALGIYSH